MTKDELIAMAKSALIERDGSDYYDHSGEPYWWGNIEELVAFSKLVAEAEREACADIVENADTPDCGGWSTYGIASSIRARGDV